MIGADGGGGEAIPGLSLLSSSVLGLVIILALFGWVWFKPAVEELKERALKAEKQRDDLIKTYEDEIIPVLREVQMVLLPTMLEAKTVLLDVKKEMEMQARERQQGR